MADSLCAEQTPRKNWKARTLRKNPPRCAPKFRPQTKKISSADEIKMHRRRNFFHLRCIFCAGAPAGCLERRGAMGHLAVSAGLGWVLDVLQALTQQGADAIDGYDETGGAA